MKIGITGASGHIGAALTRVLLEKNYDIRVLEHNDRRGFAGLPVEAVKGALSDKESLSRFCAGMDIVYHLAAKISIGINSYEFLREVNFEGTKNLVAACKKSGVKRLIYFSSIHALKHEPLDVPVDENRSLIQDGHSGYERTKALADEWVRSQGANGMEVIVLNPTAVIGPYDYKPSLIGQTIIKMYQGKLPLLVPGGYNWVDVRDVARAAATVAEKGENGQRYILAGEWQTLEGIAQIISEVAGKKVRKIVIPMFVARFGLPFIYIRSKLTGRRPLYTGQSLEIISQANKNIINEKAKRELGFNARPLKESINDTIEWFKENKYL